MFPDHGLPRLIQLKSTNATPSVIPASTCQFVFNNGNTALMNAISGTIIGGVTVNVDVGKYLRSCGMISCIAVSEQNNRDHVAVCTDLHYAGRLDI